jgi:phosphoglycerate dehydrogenase-like enzyme
VVYTRYRSDPTIEFTWALILTSARHIVTESNSVRSGGWQQTVGTDLRVSAETLWVFWDLGGLDHKSRGLGALLE